MTNKELRKLSRAELIDILFELQTQNENLTAENRELAAQLESRQLQITEAGSIAEAALPAHGVFEAAQAAAEQYVRCTKDSLAIAEPGRSLRQNRQADTPRAGGDSAGAESSLQMQTRCLESSWSQFLLDDSAQQTKNGE